MDSHAHEELWDDIRRLYYQNGGVSYITMPSWCPYDVCSECADFLTPYIFILADIGLLQLYANKLEGITRDVKLSERDSEGRPFR